MWRGIKILKYKIIFEDGRQETVTGIGNKKEILHIAKQCSIKIKSIKRIY